MECYLCGVTKNKDGTLVKYHICKTCNNKKAHQYYLKNSEKIKKRSNLWKKENKEKVIKLSKKYRTELKIYALKTYSGEKEPKCACCDETEIDFLCLDHINNDGKNKRKEHGLGTSFLKWLKKNQYPKNLGLQVLCFNCNFSKQMHGTCIHQLRRRKRKRFNNY